MIVPAGPVLAATRSAERVIVVVADALSLAGDVVGRRRGHAAVLTTEPAVEAGADRRRDRERQRRAVGQRRRRCTSPADRWPRTTCPAAPRR